MMKAYVLHGIDDLRYEQVQLPKVGPGWALVKVKACGICSSDIPRIFTKGTYHFPTIPGHEFAGIVESVGTGEDAHLIGKKVGVFPLIPCRKCAPCKKEQYEMCENYDYIGSRRDGAFAEFVAVPVWNLVVLPEKTSLDEAALMEPLAVALHAVNKLNITPCDTVAIIGTGMIGFAAAQWAVAKGAKQVSIVGRNEAKKKLAENMPGISYVLEGQAGTYTKVLEAVGTADAVCKSIQMTEAGGTVVLMGNPAGDILLPQNVYWRILRKQITLVGTWNSAYGLTTSPSDWEQTAQTLAQGSICVKPLITHSFAQEDLVQALQIMRSHSEVYCKVLVKWNEETD